MNLNKEKTKKIIEWCIWGIIALILAFFFGKVALWENNYYSEKEGSEREQGAVHAEEAQVDETEPTEEEVASWASTLPEYYPAYISLGAINQIGRQVAPLGTTAEGALDTPYNLYQVGWYKSSGAPGQGGVGVYDGHNGGPNVYGVLKSMPLMCPEGETGTRTVPNDPDLGTRECNGVGDTIAIERADGKSFLYTIIENKTIPLSQSDEYMSTAFLTPIHGKEAITIITCTGEWSQAQGTYLSRQFLRAVLK